MKNLSFSPKCWAPGIFLIYQLIMLAIMTWLLFRYAVSKPSHVIPFSFTGILPLWVPLGGALGGTTISLVGVAHHARDWDGPGYAFWHLVRPVVGLLTGSVAVLVLLFVLKGVAPDVIPKSGTTYDAGGIAVLFVLAFVVGYREETFRALVSRVVDVILGPGDADKNARGILAPAVLTLSTRGQAPATQTGTVLLVNTSKDTWALDDPMLSISPASFKATFNGRVTLAPNASTEVSVTWTPSANPTDQTGVLIANVGGLSMSSAVRGTVA